MYKFGDMFLCDAEEIKAIETSCAMDTVQTGTSFDDAIKAMERLAEAFRGITLIEIEIQNLEDAMKKIEKQYRCRVCGRHYDFKNEAKACERDHRRARR